MPFIPKFYDRYINYVPDIDILEALTLYGGDYLMADLKKFEEMGDQVYAPGKWTIKDILQHIIDTERIFSYRALRLSRFDATPLPGFDENTYADNSKVSHRYLIDLLEEFSLLRRSNQLLFQSFDNLQLFSSGRCSEVEMNVLALGFSMVGHVIHHKSIIENRYYPILSI